MIVDLGCSFDTRFERLDCDRPETGHWNWYGLDLPEVIKLRKGLLEETPRCHFIGCSVLDNTWMDDLNEQAGKPILILAEGLPPG